MKTLAALLILLSVFGAQAGTSDGGYGKPKPGTVGYTPDDSTSSEAPVIRWSIASDVDAFLKISPLSKLVSTSDGGYGKGTKVSFDVLLGIQSIQALGSLASGEIAFLVRDQMQNSKGFVIAPEGISLMEKSAAEALRLSMERQGQNVVIETVTL